MLTLTGHARLDSAQDVQPLLNQINSTTEQDGIAICGFSFGIEAGKALANCLKSKATFKVRHVCARLEAGLR